MVNGWTGCISINAHNSLNNVFSNNICMQLNLHVYTCTEDRIKNCALPEELDIQM